MRILAILALFLCAQPIPSRAGVDAPTRFGMREAIEDISLSPDGTHIAYIQPGPSRDSILYVADLDAKTAPAVVATSDAKPWRLQWCGWASNKRLVCSLYGITDNAGLLIGAVRLIAVNIDGSEPKALGKPASFRALQMNQFDGEIIGWPATDNGEVLMSRNYVPERSIGTALASNEEGLGVDRIDTLTLKSVREENPRKSAVAYIADDKGVIRILETDETLPNGMVAEERHYFYRKLGDKDWKPFSTVVKREPGLRPIAVDSSLNAAYAWDKQDGRWALFRVKLDGSMSRELVLANDRVDLDTLVVLGRSGRVIGAEFVTEKRERIVFDAEYKALLAKLAKVLPNKPLVDLVGASRNENRLLLFAGSDNDPGRYYLFDKTAKKLDEIALARPALEGQLLSNVQPVVYPAADGTVIPAYLTLPVGSTGKGLPGIVMPHGGPSYRDEWGFDWLAQYFASQGFAVLQPNFRGSAGYGDDWYAKNGFQSWRLAVGDVNDAGRWLISQGIVDNSKLAIFGWSYGGYAALQSSAIEPDLFKAIVAVAPVTDLKMMKDNARRYTSAVLVADFVGSGEHVTSGSPRRQAAIFKAPVLMFSGDIDANVDVEQSRAMDSALREAGKSSQLVIYPGLDHQLSDSVSRADMLRKSTDFLRMHLGLK